MFTWTKLTVYISTALLALIAYILKDDVKNHTNPIYIFIIQEVQSWGAWVTVLLAIAALVGNVASDLNAKEKLKKGAYLELLREIHQIGFNNANSDANHGNRVTLMKCRKSWIAFGQLELKVYCRTGKHPKSKTKLRISDHLTDCEGIAGKAWYQETWTHCDLPVWPEDEKDPASMELYAQAGHMKMRKVKLLKVKSRCVAAIVVKDASKTKWGVLVLDGCEPGCIHKSKDKKRELAWFVNLLGRQL